MPRCGSIPPELGIPDRPSSQFGVPKRPNPELARKILEDVQEYSKPFGARIAIENGVGIIRIRSRAFSGAGCRTRTRDLRFTKALLYQLS